MRRIGYLAVALAAMLWAFGGTYARVLIDRGASAREITEARAWIAALGIGIILAARKGRRLPTGDRVPRALFVLFGLSIAAANFFYYSAIAALPVAVAIVIQYTAPGLVVLWLAFVRRQRPSRRVTGALVLVLAGVALLAELPRVVETGHLRLSAGGMAAAGASALAFATYMLVGERVERSIGAEGALFRGFAVASVFWVLVQAAHGRPATILRAPILPGVIVIGIFATIVPFLLFLWGLGRIGPSRAGIVSTAEPLSAAVFAYAWLGQSLEIVQLVGAVAVVAGIAVVQGEGAPVPAPVPLE